MRIKGRKLLILGALPLVLAVAVQARGERRHGAVIMTPKQKAEVGPQADLVGKVLVRGWPVVAVRADIPNSMWWVQSAAQATRPGQFKARLRFGNERTPTGSHFKVVVLMVQTADDLKAYSPGKALKALPADVPRSAELLVEFKRNAQPEDLAEVIQQPANEEAVRRVSLMRGRLADQTVDPIILVRSAAANSLWWVQQPADKDSEGNFKSSVRFGNDKTPAGTRFRMVVLLPDAKADVKVLQPGAALKELPKDLQRSKEVQVVLQKNAAAAGIGNASGG